MGPGGRVLASCRLGCTPEVPRGWVTSILAATVSATGSEGTCQLEAPDSQLLWASCGRSCLQSQGDPDFLCEGPWPRAAGTDSGKGEPRG